jgi:predicted AAA+ superfamily ATPase
MRKLPDRTYLHFVKEDLKRKMVFIGGPRQVGKTTLATQCLAKFKPGHPAYLNWDNEMDRRQILSGTWPANEPLIILDEIHKRKGWQTLVKGAWDKWKGSIQFIVAGSARLDIFRKGGDSLLGRYHYYRLHPFSLPELGYSPENLKRLFIFGGFPEPLLQEDERELRRWHLQRVAKLVRVDLRDLENVSDLDKVEVLAENLPARVGAPLSYKSLAEDLAVSDKTVKRWVDILDNLYYCFRISPFGSPKIKALKKSQKLYLWDWSQLEDAAAKFENMVASHLLKFCHFQEDINGHKFELRYLRDELGRECDFVVLKNNKALFAVECKLTRAEISPSLVYLRRHLKIPQWYQVFLEGEGARLIEPDLKVLNFTDLCRELELC